MALARYSITTEGLVLTANIPSSIVIEQTISPTVTVQNTTSRPQTDILITISTPKEFIPFGLFQKDYAIPLLQAGEKQTILFRGAIIDSRLKEVTFSVFAALKKKNSLIPHSALKHTALLSPQTLALVIVPPSAQKGISFNERTSYTISWKNMGEKSLSHVSIGALIEGNGFNIEAIESEGGITDGKKTVLWTEKTTPSFIEIRSGMEGSATFHFILQQKAEMATQQSIRIIPFGSYEEIDGTNIDMHGTSLTIPIHSSLSLQAFGRYYTAEGEQIGRGILPPIVGKTTRYHIFLMPKNFIHPLRDVHLTARYSEQASWTGVVPQGGEYVTHYPASRHISWKLKALPPDSENRGLIFELAFMPKEEDIGSAAQLLSNITIHATDGVTGASLSASAAPVTTLLTNDEKAAPFWAVMR